MLALVNTPNGNAPVELRQTPEPVPGLHEALVPICSNVPWGRMIMDRTSELPLIPQRVRAITPCVQAADFSVWVSNGAYIRVPMSMRTTTGIY